MAAILVLSKRPLGGVFFSRASINSCNRSIKYALGSIGCLYINDSASWFMSGSIRCSEIIYMNHIYDSLAKLPLI